MIIRGLRENEKHKRDMLFAASFGMGANLEQAEKENLDLSAEEYVCAFEDDNETLMALVSVQKYKSMFRGHIVKASGIAGVSTLPKYRRAGCIRKIMERIFELSAENGWITSFLYPFSFSYYRKFGYERVLTHKTMKFPFEAIRHIERNADAIIYTGERLDELLDLYNKFSARYNISFIRGDGKHYSDKPYDTKKYTYIWQKDGEMRSYVTCVPENGDLKIMELCYLDNESLLGILGFLRVFDGQYGSLLFSFLDKNSPLDIVIASDRNSFFGSYDGAMGRVVDIEKILGLLEYPAGEGSVSLEITGDVISSNNGGYIIDYKDGTGIPRRESMDRYDATISCVDFSRLAFGDVATEYIQYMQDSIFISKIDVFKKMFSPTENSLFERF